MRVTERQIYQALQWNVNIKPVTKNNLNKIEKYANNQGDVG